jgi:hypothetical protein
MAQGQNCGTISDGCGGMVYCGNCELGEACGAGGTPHVCAAAEQIVCSGQACPNGYTSVYNLTTNITYGSCTAGSCSAPAEVAVCVVSNLAAMTMQGCDLSCPTGYAELDVLVSCTCPSPPSFYMLCLPN